MDLGTISFTVTDWQAIPAVEHKGETGTSFWRTFESGGLRVRMVDYSPGFLSDQWCPKGHVLLVIEGEFSLTLKDGRSVRLSPGMGFAVGEDPANPHLAASEKGARAFIVD